MQPPVLHKIFDQQLWLSPYRCIFWEEEKTLIVSDLHFGKTGHFRKSGIAVPQSVYKEDLQRLVNQLQFFKPRQLIVVGDLFHSHENKELDWFRKWRNDFPDLHIHLVKGNHDILDESWYRDCNIHLAEDELMINHFRFQHDLVMPPGTEKRYSFSGHIHPGIYLSGTARQSLRFPCFYFAKDYCVLPAFSLFTGFAMIRPSAGEHVFAIVEQSIVQLQ